MEKYKQWRPTSFDGKGLNAEYYGIGEYLVLGVSHNRDSGCLSESNWHTALEMLGGEDKDVQVHRFNHWGPGWFEIILINPDNKEKLAIAEDIESRLANYPILDEDDFSNRQYEEICSYWDNMSISERIEILKEHNCNFLHARYDYIKDDSIYQHIRDRIEVF